MANKSSTMTATFLHSTTLLLAQILLFSFVRSDEAVCDKFCPPVGHVDGWETSCHLQQSTAHCGDLAVSDVPSAPRKLIVRDITHDVQGTTLLGLNISWVLPVTGNFTGLEGFYVHVIQTSYPAGYDECNGIRFDRPLTVSSFASEIVFSFSCLRKIDIDSKFSITITSIGSNQSTKTDDYHTSNCAKVPGVGGCPLDIVPDDEWEPSQKPTAEVWGTSVHVGFSIYPGDVWITYKINLKPCSGQPTPRELSQIVDTEGATGSYRRIFKKVPPGCYSAHVSLYERPDRSIVDGYDVWSEPFNVTQEEPTSPPDVDKSTVVSTSSQNPEEGVKVTTDVSENSENDQNTKTKPKTIEFIGAGIGIAVALVLVLLLIFGANQTRKSRRNSELADPQETPRQNLVNNMVQNDPTAPGHCDPYGHCDSVSVYRSEHPHGCNCEHGFTDDPEDYRSVTNLSGVTV